MFTKTKSKHNPNYKYMFYIICLSVFLFFLSFKSIGYISHTLKYSSIIIFIYLSILFIIYNYATESNFLKRLILYTWIIPILFIISIIISHLFIIDSESARYSISALVQSDAAILAIYITLSLVTVQLASSSYSPRVIKVFNNREKNPDFWILVTIYILAIIYGASILNQIDISSLFIISDYNLINELFSLQNHIIFTYFLCSYTIVALLPNIKNTINFLDPFCIISLLSGEITKEGILDFIDKKKSNAGDTKVKNPLLPILDIVRTSIINYDNETSVNGIEISGSRIISITETQINQEEGLKISQYFIENMSVILQLALEKKNEQSVSQIIKCEGELAKATQKKGMKEIREYYLESLQKMEYDVIKGKMHQATLSLALVFLEIAELSDGSENYIKNECIDTINSIIDQSISKELYSVVIDISASLKNSVLKSNIDLDAEKIKDGYVIRGKKYQD